MTVGKLAEQDDIIYDKKFSSVTIRDIYTNTEKAIQNGDSSSLFICISGSKYDTHKDIDRLISSGITNVVTEKEINVLDIPDNINIIKSDNTRKTLAIASKLYFGCPDENMKIIGITGTKGKTTISYMIANVLSKSGIKCGIIGTNGIIYGDKTYPCDNSTPCSYEFYSHLRQMADSGVEYVIAEITSQSLKQYRTFGTMFDIAVFTNLYPDHIGKNEHSDFCEYRKCKSMLFKSCKKAVLNMDDENYDFFADTCRQNLIPFVTFSRFFKKADYRARFCREKSCETSFKLLKRRINVPLPGEFNIRNALCASVVLLETDIDIKNIVSGLSDVIVPGRCERVDNPLGINIIIDYAHSKESLENILKALKKNCKGKLYCVFGAGGDRSNLRRCGMGEATSKYADFSIITSDNPRSENPELIIKDILKGIPENYSNYSVIPDREEAIVYALSCAKKDDTVLLAGKGTQNYQEINGVKYHFDERQTVSNYYKNLIIQQ